MQANSHSTMYLLKRSCSVSSFELIYHSHSTMYLLKPDIKDLQKKLKDAFTFHHVSIKTLDAMASIVS